MTITSIKNTYHSHEALPSEQKSRSIRKWIPTSPLIRKQVNQYLTVIGSWCLSILFIIFCAYLWFWTQSLIGAREFPSHGIGDSLHEQLKALNTYLHDHPSLSNALLIASSIVIDLIGLFLIIQSVFGPTIRPILGLLILCGMR